MLLLEEHRHLTYVSISKKEASAEDQMAIPSALTLFLQLSIWIFFFKQTRLKICQMYSILVFALFESVIFIWCLLVH